MIVTDCRLFKVGYDFSKDLYIAVFQVNFHLIKDEDLISDLPGYDVFEERACTQIDALFSREVGKATELEPQEEDVEYETRAPVMPESWGLILWTTTCWYRPELLEGAMGILDWWERAVRLVQLKSSLKEQDQPIVWADEIDLRRTKEA